MPFEGDVDNDGEDDGGGNNDDDDDGAGRDTGRSDKIGDAGGDEIGDDENGRSDKICDEIGGDEIGRDACSGDVARPVLIASLSLIALSLFIFRTDDSLSA